MLMSVRKANTTVTRMLTVEIVLVATAVPVSKATRAMDVLVKVLLMLQNCHL